MKIKHSFLIISLLIATNTKVFSQDNFVEGTNMINVGLGLGDLYYNGFVGANLSSTPAITLSLDHGLKKVEEIQGTIGIGGIVGFQSATFRTTYTREHWNNFIIAPRGTYHAGFLNTQQFDLYGGIMIGVRIESYTFSSTNGSVDLGNYGGVYPTGGAFVGGAWYFVSTAGLFAEIGYDVSYIKIGFTFKTGTQKTH